MFTTATGSKVEQSILGSKQRPAASQKWAEKLRGRCAGGLTECSPHTLGITEEPGSVVRDAWVWISPVVDCVCLVLLNELPFPHMTHETRSPLEDERIKWESTRWANTYSTKCLSFTGHPSLKHRCWSSVWEFLLQDDGFYGLDWCPMVGEQACGTISACLGRQGLETHGYQKPCLKMVKSKHKAYMGPGQGPRRSWPNFLQTGSVKKKKKSKAVRFTFFDRIITLLFFSINTVLTHFRKQKSADTKKALKKI